MADDAGSTSRATAAAAADDGGFGLFLDPGGRPRLRFQAPTTPLPGAGGRGPPPSFARSSPPPFLLLTSSEKHSRSLPRPP
ncbi:hypothetical protein Zm00014a_014351 [Zea mays]|uniref:Uncharacterized protein n=1 Tax=Zea mays TaxID=4577 RepID=A0A317Y4W3_MAIZE|nr:hypothetical protein Zm00014a_014351 [Zea mays]